MRMAGFCFNIRHQMRVGQVPDVLHEIAPYEDEAAENEDQRDVQVEVDM